MIVHSCLKRQEKFFDILGRHTENTYRIKAVQMGSKEGRMEDA